MSPGHAGREISREKRLETEISFALLKLVRPLSSTICFYSFLCCPRSPDILTCVYRSPVLLRWCTLLTTKDLTEPIDVYTDWIDECEAVNAVEGEGEERKDDDAFIDNLELAEG